MNPGTLHDQSCTGGAAPGLWNLRKPVLGMLPKRTTLQRRKAEEEGDRRYRGGKDGTHDVAPAESEMEEDSVRGEADRPPPPSEKPDA